MEADAFASEGPVLIEFISAPDVPPLPHVSWSQAKAYMTTLGEGDPDERGVIVQTLREVLAGFQHRGHNIACTIR